MLDLNLVYVCSRFEALIEREWVQAGHPFKSRCCKSVYSKTDSKFESPVFLVFLDSVWQVREIICAVFG